MKKNLLVTLADKNYIDQAKQLFSSVYFNAGFKGDYMLLSHDIAEKDLEWFKNKGILIKKCKPLYNKEVGKRSPVLTSKFYLFTPEFKEWDNVIYLDADIIVRASLDELTKVKGFAAVIDFALKEQLFNNDNKLFSQINNNYNLNKLSLGAGVLAFNTDIIKDDSLSQLKGLLELYETITRFGDQLAWNLFFYEKWQALPLVYNTYINPVVTLRYLKPERIDGIILHFIGDDSINFPWNPASYFYSEWKNNLNKADSIDLKEIPMGKKWSQKKIIINSIYLSWKFYHSYFSYSKKREAYRLLFRRFLFFINQNLISKIS